MVIHSFETRVVNSFFFQHERAPQPNVNVSSVAKVNSFIAAAGAGKRKTILGMGDKVKTPT